MRFNRLLTAIFSGKAKGHFSQYGEDIVIHKLFPRNFTHGTYIDIGAFHPFYFSNTAYLWLKGWSGVNVDANPNSIRLFEKSRPQDTNIWGAVVSSKVSSQERVRLYMAADGINAMGTCDESTAKERGLTKAVEVPAFTAAQIFSRLGSEKPDFLNIDIEGLDAVVLEELDLSLFSPKVICIEIHAPSVQASLASSSTDRLLAHGYRIVARVGPSSIFLLDA